MSSVTVTPFEQILDKAFQDVEKRKLEQQANRRIPTSFAPVVDMTPQPLPVNSGLKTVGQVIALPTTLTKDVLFGVGKGAMNLESAGTNLVGNALAPTAAGFRGAVDGFNENGFGGMVKQGVSNYVNEYDYQGREIADALLNAVGVGSNLAQNKLDSGFDKTRTADAMIFDDAGNTGAGYYHQASNKLNEIDDFYDS